MLIVGIDMAKSKFDVGLWVNQKGEPLGHRLQVKGLKQ